MPIITVEWPLYRPAKEIIDDLCKLLLERRDHNISKNKFHEKYGPLRKELEETPEWFDFRQAVIYRSSGRCERLTCCNPGAHVHHLVRISHDPRFALDPNMAQYLCEYHHENVDASHRRWLRNVKRV